MSEPWEWVEADLKTLVENEASEDLELDFKECRALAKSDGKKRELAKDVSAFANSAGGTLVYGIIEDDQTHAAASLDRGYDPADISQEWIEQVINSNIHPRLSGVRINRVSLSKSSPGKVAYVVYVPKGTTAHQAADNRYYKRFNFQSVPMEDYEVRDVMQRTTSANLETRFLIGGASSGKIKFAERENGFESPPIEVVISNSAYAGIAQYSQHKVFLSIDARSYGTPFEPSTTTVLMVGGPWEYACRVMQIGNTKAPIFADEERRILTFSYRLSPDWPFDEPFPFVVWRTWAAGSLPSEGAVLFTRLTKEGWAFRPATIGELGDLGMRVEFGR